MTDLPFAFQAPVVAGPLVHALIIGCSKYDSAPNLRCGATTAFYVYRALQDAHEKGRLVAPLATVTLLLSPSDAEADLLARCISSEHWRPATKKNVLAAFERHWELIKTQERTCTAPTDAAGSGLGFYYFGGHGADNFRDDPVGFPCDAEKADETWRGLLNHFEQRHRLTSWGSGPKPLEEGAAMRHLFLYDCCSEWLDGVRSDAESEVRWKPESAQARQFAVIKAAAAGFKAWEPKGGVAHTEDLADPDRSLSFFGYGLLHCLKYCDEASTYGKRWQTSAQSLAARVPNAIRELAFHDCVGKPIAGAGAQAARRPDFPLVLSDTAPAVHVHWAADPVDDHRKTRVRIAVQHGSPMSPFDSGCPWTEHPFSVRLTPGVFSLELVHPEADEPSQLRQRFEPVVTRWSCIVGHGNITVRDPRG
jgi:hypothetical protein